MRIPAAPVSAGARLALGLFSAATALGVAAPAPALRGARETLDLAAAAPATPAGTSPASSSHASPPPAAASQTPSPPPAPAPSGAAAYRLLENRLTAREPFNNASQKVRVVAFLAPSCPRCLANAGELQREILAKNPSADIAVILIWLKVLDKDDETAVAAAAARCNDPRVTHFWDPQRLLNAQLLDAITFDVNLRLYDVFLLYDKKAVWEKRLPRPGFWMHEYKGAPGPWWNVTAFAAEVSKGLRGEAFTPPVE